MLRILKLLSSYMYIYIAGSCGKKLRRFRAEGMIEKSYSFRRESLSRREGDAFVCELCVYVCVCVFYVMIVLYLLLMLNLYIHC